MKHVKKHWSILLVVAFVSALGWSTVPSSAHAVAAAPTTATAGSLPVINSLFESRVVTLTNQRRAARGCPPLRVRSTLRYAARKHTIAMAKAGVLSHRLSGEPRLGRRITLAGYRDWRIVAENIAAGFLSPSSVVRAWMRSPGHRANILDCRLRHIGVGVALHGTRLWWTQNFGRR